MHRILLSLFALALAACLTRPAPVTPPTPGHLLGVELLDPDPGGDSTRRAPRLRLRFDIALLAVTPGAVWLVRQAPTDTLLNNARRATATAPAGTIAHAVDADPADPTTLLVTATETLEPDDPFTLVLTTQLATAGGAPVIFAGTASGPAAFPYRVAPARRARTQLGWLAPGPDGLSSDARVLALRADRPLGAAQWGSLSLSQSEAALAPLIEPACGDEVQGFRCALLTLPEALAVGALAVSTDGVLDARGLPVELLTAQLPVREAGAPTGLSTPVASPVCALDEQLLTLACVRLRAEGVELRTATSQGALLSATLGPRRALSAWGLAQSAALEGLEGGVVLPLALQWLSVNGAATDAVVLDPLTVPGPLPRLRITEVLAHPGSGAAQEFVELLNVGDDDAQTAGLWLYSDSGRSALPDGALAPGQRAVLVAPAYDPRGVPSRGDPAVEPGAVLLRSTAALGGHGLSDSGSDLYLADRDGHRISAAPLRTLGYTPRAAVSVVRSDLLLDEATHAAWAYDARASSTPGGADALR